ncbi:MAG: glycosyltransferase family 4 protein, partial [Candidatus Zixiibacteriota bacterium]
MKNKRIVMFGWADSIPVQRWCKGLAGRGWQIKLISTVGIQMEGIETVILPRNSMLSYFSNIWRAKAEAKLHRPDLVHAHYVTGNGLLALSSGIRPMVSSVWGSDIDTRANNWLANMIAKKVILASNQVTATSGFLKSQIQKRVKHVSVSVIPFGVRIPPEIKQPPDPRPFKICYLKPHKAVYGPDVLVEALAIVVREFPEVELTMAGDQNEYTVKIKQQIVRNDLESRVKFVGFVKNENVHSFISENHLLVMPSRSEGFGVSAVEAGAGGRAVVATNVGGIPEIVSDGKSGLLVPPDDPLALANAIL